MIRLTWARAWPVPAALTLIATLTAGVPADPGPRAARSPAVTLQPVPDQRARVVTASATGGVDWGNEPVVVTLRAAPADVALSVAVTPAGLLTARLGGMTRTSWSPR